MYNLHYRKLVRTPLRRAKSQENNKQQLHCSFPYGYIGTPTELSQDHLKNTTLCDALTPSGLLLLPPSGGCKGLVLAGGAVVRI